MLARIEYGDGDVCVASPDLPVGTPLHGVRIEFYWERRPDPLSIGQGGFFENTTQRLRAIDISENLERVRVYQLSYQNEPTNARKFRLYRSWLAEVQQFGSDAQVSSTGTVMSGRHGRPGRSGTSPKKSAAAECRLLCYEWQPIRA